MILVSVFGGTVLFQAVQEPPDFEGGGEGFVGSSEPVSAPPQQTQVATPTQDMSVLATPVNNTSVNAITTTAASPMNFNMSQMVMAPPAPARFRSTTLRKSLPQWSVLQSLTQLPRRLTDHHAASFVDTSQCINDTGS
ncbi:MAG: hypothetical protein EBU85_08140 [Actinobacteria bacterium]|nr:hypothetical protein [Actinomycetota bacterium]